MESKNTRNRPLVSYHVQRDHSTDEWPRFNREPSVMEEYMILVSGGSLYMETTLKQSQQAHIFIEVQIPRDGCVSFAHPVLLAVYNNHVREELILVIFLTDGVHKVAFERLDDLNLVSGIHSFTFRTPEECKLWFAVISDVKIASGNRLCELLDLKHAHAPRGYRTHFAAVLRSFEPVENREERTQSAISNSHSILNLALSCIDYLSSRLDRCQCSNNISLEMEDTVYETRSRLCELISRNSYLVNLDKFIPPPILEWLSKN